MKLKIVAHAISVEYQNKVYVTVPYIMNFTKLG